MLYSQILFCDFYFWQFYLGAHNSTFSISLVISLFYSTFSLQSNVYWLKSLQTFKLIYCIFLYLFRPYIFQYSTWLFSIIANLWTWILPVRLCLFFYYNKWFLINKIDRPKHHIFNIMIFHNINHNESYHNVKTKKNCKHRRWQS